MHPVVHFDIPVSEQVKAKQFFSTLFGWTINDIPGADYSIVLTTETDEQSRPAKPGAINGGMALRKNLPAQQPVMYVSVEDIDAMLKRIEQAGGTTVLPKKPIGEWGAYALFADPDGNVFGLHQEKA